jgi:hypothetical protein
VYLRQTCPGAGRERRGETAARRVLFDQLFLTLMSYVESGDARRVLLPFADGIGFAPRGDRAPDGRPTATAAAPADPPPILFDNFSNVVVDVCGRASPSRIVTL